MKLQSPWNPRLSGSEGAPFEQLASALAEDIAAGVLAAGDRLPAHRDLAWTLEIGVGTVTKAYAALERRGLVRSAVGRGMFVAGGARVATQSIDLSINGPPQMLDDRLLSATLATLAKRLDAGTFAAYAEPAGRLDHRRQMARWLGKWGLDASPERILLTHGAQHGLSIAFAAALPPGAVLLTEATTYPGALLIGRRMGIPVTGLAMDDEGLRPDAFEAALRMRRRDGPAALYVTPTLQNPTTSSMGPDRRREIVRLARQYDLLIIEDDVYGIFGEPDQIPLAMLAPERTFHVSGLSKTLSPGLRIGSLTVPAPFLGHALDRLQMSSTTASALSTQIMELWMTDGTADMVAAAIRGEAGKRCALAHALLPQEAGLRSSNGFHAWLPMPTSEAESLVARAAAAGIVLMPARAPLTDAADPEGGVRLCLGAPSPDQLTQALRILAGLLASPARTSI